VGDIVDCLRRHLELHAALDVGLVAVDQDHQPAARSRSLIAIAGVADVGDQPIVIELLQLGVGKRFEAHG
jgi:hypothetical protein